jgi:hypothetical protein
MKTYFCDALELPLLLKNESNVLLGFVFSKALIDIARQHIHETREEHLKAEVIGVTKI